MAHQPTVRHHDQRVEIEKLRDTRAVVLHLVEGPQRVRLLLVGILQLEDHERQPVHIHQHIGPPVILPADRELIHHAEIIRRRIRPIHRMHMLERLHAVRAPVFLLVAARQQLVKVEVPLLRRHALRPEKSRHAFLDRLRRKMRVFLSQKSTQAVRHHHLAQIPLDPAAIFVAVAERAQTFDGRLLKLRFSSLVRHWANWLAGGKWRSGLMPQRGIVSKPKVAAQRLPWERRTKCENPNGVAA